MLTEIEHEKKMMITEEEYARLTRLLVGGDVKRYEQTNFYYDTADDGLRKRNVTLRIRLKNGKLMGTRKTHFAGNLYSVEEHFRVAELPVGFCVDHEYVRLKGSLRTERTEILLTEGVTLFLDRNSYLEVTDYELELEYTSGEAVAEGVMLLLRHLIGRKAATLSECKSERFFRRLTSGERREAYAIHS